MVTEEVHLIMLGVVEAMAEEQLAQEAEEDFVEEESQQANHQSMVDPVAMVEEHFAVEVEEFHLFVKKATAEEGFAEEESTIDPITSEESREEFAEEAKVNIFKDMDEVEAAEYIVKLDRF